MKILNVLIWLVLITSFILFFVTVKPKSPIDKEIRVVKLINPNAVPSNQILDHNNKIISTLLQRESIAFDILITKEGFIKQARTIYVAIITLLLSLMFSKQLENVKKYIELILILLIGMMYLVETHSIDLLERQETCVEIISRSTEKVVNTQSLDSVLYFLDYEKYISEIKAASNGRHIRKYLRACHPDLDQTIYIIPLIFIFILFNNSVYRKDKK
jgi:hypothetical protein